MLLRCLLLCLLLFSSVATASTYDVTLPATLATDPDLCRLVDCGSVMPNAVRFSQRKGNPAYVEAYAKDGQVMGYVYLSTDVADIPAYSGKPVVTLVGLDSQGRIAGVRILKHSEPILLLGIPEQKLVDYVQQYLGHLAGTRFELGKAEGQHVSVDAISGATVTLIAENQLITRTSRAIARQVGLIASEQRPQAALTKAHKQVDWATLLAEGSIGRLQISHQDVGQPAQGNTPYLDLYFGYLNAPAIGRSVLGDAGFQTLMARLQPGEHAIFVIASGTGSFKGSGFVRGGIYDRIQLRQGQDIVTFRDSDYLNLYALMAAGHPGYTESGIFIVRDPAFSAAYPWSFTFLGNQLDAASNQKTFTNFEADYWLPAAYLEGGRPVVEQAHSPWLAAWQAKMPVIAAFAGLLITVVVFHSLRTLWQRRSRRGHQRWISWPKMACWLIAIFALGGWQMAQPSVTQLLTLLHAPFDGWRWSLFLSEPLIFLFWLFIALTVLLWGRGVFCGWLCPFGALSELMFKLGGGLGLRRFQRKLPQQWHDRLKWLKYIVLAILVAISFHSMILAEQLAEIEPFKTTFLLGIWQRSWPYGLFVVVILGASILIERPYCKYLCPLGAGLGLPSRLRLFALRRKHECGTCQACAVSCGSQAISADGRIDPMECLQCLDCMVYYYDDHACPPLAKERKRRAKAGEPLTAVGRDGYFIPIKVVK
ncbi:NosR/NirI family nitrous oxide reductase transcriptional regulator [Chitinivorax tropicus]|uniref:NosR/NirI family nitrous oxide reductase transcriptional regulator n=1 Tax=Chitinivorax tropicus TaxID=714531 RepID=A0A840MNC8_9PROT|nr:4Fe-4S binding protein [Chitinivorax tropicus]MBB5018487.1 NosR/NirI family nitrous oxide reductase transcriptional regulator [Chitinivorax tropicus]